MSVIHVLSSRLANQIAAGEVVERPASVVKEVLENSLDSGATQIDIDIEAGGTKLIKVRDNGAGIEKDDLPLALCRHATSKIAQLDDLEAVATLGFRGEALASISSVSRLELTSSQSDDGLGWRVVTAGRDMEATVEPARHARGSTVEVRDLFFNTPARRKFLKKEKTEFSHIEQIVRRLALSHFDVGFQLRHGQRTVFHLKPAQTPEQQQRRLAQVCGQAFLEQALSVDVEQGEMMLRGGWVCPRFREAKPTCNIFTSMAVW